MHKTCDDETRTTLDGLIGRRLQRVVAMQHGHVGPYLAVSLAFEDEYWVQPFLTAMSIAWKFEVFVIGARPGTEPKDTTGWDRLEFNDFVVAEVNILRRDEWIEEFDGPLPPTIGNNPVAQHAAPAGQGPRDKNAVTVDTGVRLVSTNRAELTLDADSFPMTFHLTYRAGSCGQTVLKPDVDPESAQS